MLLIVMAMLLAPAGILAAPPATRPAPPVWPPADGVPMTVWGRQVSTERPVLPEYPRPQLVRTRWLNLNGLWDYAITPENNSVPSAYDGKILVPFPIESVLSQVNKRVDEHSRLWYRRTLQIPADWAGQHVLLHFGAIDWEAIVSINGKTFPSHRGGYDGFSMDVTDSLKPTGSQELIVSVWDPTEGGQPRGKQTRHPQGIFYTPTTGIWQTVWLEPVPASHIQSLKMIPDVDGGQLKLTVAVENPEASQTIDAIVTDDGKEVARATGKPGEPLLIPLPHARLWGPDDPFLYGLTVALKQGGAPASAVDSAESYFGMRKISIGPDARGITRILLNNTFVLHNGFLDQGFWPDGVYTAPSDAALRYDIEMSRKLGFNMCRKHIKVEPDRWYYWADKLGLMVWQDMPADEELMRKNTLISDPAAQFELEMRRMIDGRFNHPSIVMWILFNEGMGLEMNRNEKDGPTDRTRALLQRLVNVVREADPTRLINHESGAGGGAWQGMNPWDVGLGDIVDFHCYGKSNGPVPEKTRASVIGEYGWGVSPVSSVGREIGEVNSRGISGLVLTQLTDVENEKNGVLTYDRQLKGHETAEQLGDQIRKVLKSATNTPEEKK
jgi:beta-galactosidase/beta-glucuronidase